MSVPGSALALQGVWYRTCYQEPAGEHPAVVDESTHVVWLQVGYWHADLRIPAERPDFSDVSAIRDCDRPQLIWLAHQTAFAGITCVEGRFCCWHRLFDLTPTLNADIGILETKGDTLIESHPSGTYTEYWSCQDDDHDKHDFLVILNDAGLPVWLQHGTHGIWIDAHRGIDDGHDLLAAPEALDNAALRSRLDLTFSYARRDQRGWHIQWSTLPWLEGSNIQPPDTQNSDNRAHS